MNDIVIEYEKDYLEELYNNGKRPVTTDFALMMKAALGINPELLINMQTRYNMSVARQKDACASGLFCYL